VARNIRLQEVTLIFYQMSDPPLLIRLGRELKGAGAQFAQHPADYLSAAILPANAGKSFPVRLARVVSDAGSAIVRHPIGFLRGAFSLDAIGKSRRRRLVPVLTVVAFFYLVFCAYAVYEAFLSPYAKVRVTDNSNYRKFDPNWVLAKLSYPPGMLHQPSAGPVKSLEDIRKDDAERKRKAEIAKEEREKKAKEEEAKRAEEAKKQAEETAKKEAEAKAAEAKAAETKDDKSKSFGEINIAPIRDIVSKLYNMYLSGDVTLADSFKIMVSFKIDPDGSIPRSSIHVIKSSESKVVDQNAVEILWQLGESHALGPLSSLSSNTIELDVNDNNTKLSITSFAATPEEASAKATSISFMLKIVAATQKTKNPAVWELLSHLTVKADNKRIDATMIVPKARASEMMKSTFAKSDPTSQ
jgi:hypothetical protein